MNFLLNRSATADGYWIGLYKYTKQSNSETYWLDNSTSTYRNWDASEPDQNAYCVLMTYMGKFADEQCSDEYGFICKQPESERSRFSHNHSVLNDDYSSL